MKEALLVIDLQNDILHEAGRRSSLGVWKYAQEHNTIGNIAKAIELAEARDIPIIYVKVVRRHGCPSIPDRGRFQKNKQNPAFEEGTWGAEFVPELKIRPGDTVVTKSRFSAFYGTDLNMLLTGLEISTLIICGVSPHACINATIVDAVDRDYNVIALKDCMAGPNEEIVNSMFNIWSLWDVKVTTASKCFSTK